MKRKPKPKEGTISLKKKSTFLERAAKFGHSIEALKAGMTVSTTIEVNNVDQLKEVLSDTGEEQDMNIGKLLFEKIPMPDADDESPNAVLRRVNDFIYNGGDLSAADRTQITNGFPMEVVLTSAPDYTPKEPVIINSPAKPMVYNYGTLTLNNGIYFSVYQTVVTFNIDKVVRVGSNGNPNIGDFNIFGATGTAGDTGDTGATGTTGANGSKGTCTSGGGIAGDKGGNGGTGATGATGGPGTPGNPGQPSMQATININNEVSGNLYFFTRSGTGGNGGHGGKGGRGGTGGNGGKGASCGCECTNGGNAGNGGTGGIGGTGGNGANGVNAAGNIVVTIPSSAKPNVFKSSANAAFGSYGKGGDPGGGGPAGSKGGGGGASGCPSCKSGSDGSGGGGGSQGQNGNPGTVSGLPATINIVVI
jgi:hypothetical protein